MAKSIGFFTACEQGQALVSRFGDGDLPRLYQVDQSALLVALGGFLMAMAVGTDEYGEDVTLTLNQAADEFVSETYLEYASDDFVDAIAILEGINLNDAIAIIHFLSQ